MQFEEKKVGPTDFKIWKGKMPDKNNIYLSFGK
jgi:hypothetical protein